MATKKPRSAPKYKLGDRIIEAQKSNFSLQKEKSRRKGTIIEAPDNTEHPLAKRNSIGAIYYHYKVRWDNGRSEVYNQHRLQKEES